jgi:hypothetical protein
LCDAKRLAVEGHLAFFGLVKPGEHVEQRGLARTVRAEQATDLAAPDTQVNAVKSLQATEEFAD